VNWKGGKTLGSGENEKMREIYCFVIIQQDQILLNQNFDKNILRKEA
jgi:hypothetical protein